MLNIFGGVRRNTKLRDEVIITFILEGGNLDALHSLEKELDDCLNDSDVGYHDGHETPMADDSNEETFLFFYGANAEKLFITIHPILKSNPIIQRAKANLTFVKPDESRQQIEVDI